MQSLKWRYIKDGIYPENGEECLIEDAFGHRCVGEFCKRLIIDIDENDEKITYRDNVFINNLLDKGFPNEIARWCPMSEILIATDLRW